MNITINEIKKILNIKSLIIVSLITVLMYMNSILPRFDVMGSGDIINEITSGMVNKYGNTVDENEFRDFKKTYESIVEEAEDYIKRNKEFKELGIYNYEEFYKITRNSGEEKYENPKLNELYWNYVYSEDISLFGELMQMENIIITYEYSVLKGGYDNTSPIPYNFFETYEDQIKQEVVVIILSIAFLISPIFFDDRKEKTDCLQYSSKRGRNLFKNKIFASVIVAIIVSVVQLGIFMMIYSKIELQGNTRVFLDCNVSGWFNSPMESWYDITFKEYMIITSICVVILGVVFTLLSAFISSKVNTFISLIGVQVPIIFISNMYLLQFIINYVTSMHIRVNRIGDIAVGKYYTPIIYGLLLMSTIAIIVYRYKKELSTDIA